MNDYNTITAAAQEMLKNIETEFYFIGPAATLPEKGNNGDIVYCNGCNYVYDGSGWEPLGEVKDSTPVIDKTAKKRTTCEHCNAVLDYVNGFCDFERNLIKCDYCGGFSNIYIKHRKDGVRNGRS